MPLDEQQDIDDWHVANQELASSELNSHVVDCEQGGSISDVWKS